VHYSEATRSVGSTVPVGSAAWNQPEEIGQRLQPFDVLRRVAGMFDFQTIEPGRHQRLQFLPPSSVAGVSPDRKRTGLVSDRDRILYRETLLGHKRASIAP